MKFNPYAALLTTGALMVTTVVMLQTESSTELLRAGVASVDRDVSSFAAKTWTSLEGHTLVATQSREPVRTHLASIDASIDDRQHVVAQVDDY